MDGPKKRKQVDWEFSILLEKECEMMNVVKYLSDYFFRARA